MTEPAAAGTRIASWSNVCPTTTRLAPWPGREANPPAPWIARGGGRSFGDAAFITHGTTFTSEALRHLTLDAGKGLVTCGAGLSMVELHRALERAGRGFPVYGGTQWATIGGAVASDIHGKDDPAVGSFGNHVESLVVSTPGRGIVECSREENPDLFAATIGGMGLTGFILAATLRLQAAGQRCVRIRAERLSSLREALACFRDLPGDFQVCDWMVVSSRPRLVFWHASYTEGRASEPRPGLDVWLPRVKLFNRWSVRAMESAVWGLAARFDAVLHIRHLNYGGGHNLLRNWNRLFGRRGFIEYHFALDEERFEAGVEALVALARRHGITPVFGVIKRFGMSRREGLLSFPGAGYGLNFQVEEGVSSRRFLRDLTEALLALEGRVYLAKDSVVSSSHIERMYPRLPQWRQIVQGYDPDNRVRSDLSVRLDLKPW